MFGPVPDDTPQTPTRGGGSNKPAKDSEGGNPNAGLKKASSVASSFLTAVGEIETELEQEVLSLEEQVGFLGTHIDSLNVQIGNLKKALDEVPDCDDDDEMDFRTDEDLARGNGTPQPTRD